MHCWFQSSKLHTIPTSVQDIPLFWKLCFFAPCKGIQGSPGFRILFQWNLDSWFFNGFLELYSGIQSPGFQISQAKITLIPESRFHHMGRRFGSEDTNFKLISRLEFGHICKAWILGSVLWSNVVNDGTKEPGRPPILVRLMGGLTVSNYEIHFWKI